MSARTMLAFAAGVVVTIVVGAAFSGSTGGATTSAAAIELTTVEAQIRTMRTHVDYDGTLEIGVSDQLTAGRSGTVTAAALPGSTLESGGTVVRIDDEPVTVIYGDVPMYRDLALGDVGADVAQLEVFLAVGGYDAASLLTVDDTFTSATASALAVWQEQVGLEPTGALALGSFVVATGPVEVLEVASVGDLVRDGGTLATVSSDSEFTADISDGDVRPLPVTTLPTTPTIAFRVVPDEIDNFEVDAVVEVETADGTLHRGSVTEIGSVAVSDPQNDAAEAGVTVVIEVDPTDGLLAGPAVVRVVETERADVVIVPTRALVALAEGGQAVEVVGADGERQLVGVELGIFDDGWVEVTSATTDGAVQEGTEVVAPS